jgi:hypothetical protein
MATVTVIARAPTIVQVIAPIGSPTPAPATGLPARVVKVVMDRGPSPALLTGIAEEAVTRERDDPLALINALLNPGL